MSNKQVVDRKLVRQYRRGPEKEEVGHTVYAKSISETIDTEEIEKVGILGIEMKRVRKKSAKVIYGKFLGVDCFVFDFGCIVLWGCTRPQLARVIEHVLIPPNDRVKEPPCFADQYTVALL